MKLVLITHHKEPLLIYGESGFKTYLSSLIHPNAPIIPLNQDNSISQLLGSIELKNTKRSKEFYLDQFCKILHIKDEYQNLLSMLNGEIEIPSLSSEIPLFEDVLPEKTKILISESDSDLSINFSDEDDDKSVPKKNDNLNEVQITNERLEHFGQYLYVVLKENLGENIIPDSFKRILEHLIDNIQENIDIGDDNNSLSDFTTVFKPGLFTSAVLEQYSLILKDMPNLPPQVYERFNQLNSNNPSLTLNEDYCNTFTTPNMRTLNHFSNNFRIISISSTDSAGNLSEAAQSRITKIYSPSYSEDECNSAIASISLSINQSTLKPVEYLQSFSQQYSSKFDKKMSFPYLTKILKFVNLLNNISELEIEEKLSIAIYRIICGPLKDNSNKMKILNILDEVFGKEMNLTFKALVNNKYKEESPFSHKNAGTSTKVISNISKLSISCLNFHNDDLNIAFVNPFIDMIDAIFTGLVTHYPVIIEGMTGKGIFTAIKYVANTIGYKYVKFNISSATTPEDFYCKIIPTRKNGKLEFVFTPSKILNIISSESSDDKTLIVIEGLNQSSSTLRDSIAPLFDPSKSSFLLSNGDIIQKGNYNIIAIYDPSSINTNEYALPESFKINSIYHAVSQYSMEQINKIAIKIFNDGDKLTNDHITFMNHFHIMSKFTPKTSINQLYTFNDIKKYKLFTEGPLNQLESFVAENMILLYKYSAKEDIEDAINLLNIDVSDLWPKFFIKNFKLYASLTSQNTKTLSINIDHDRIEESKEAYLRINSLTQLQRNCILFLMYSVLSKQAAIVSGPTASGKSYIIPYFAHLVGKKLIRIIVNNDTGISTLTGQFAPSSSLSLNDIDDIKKCFNILCTEVEIKNEITGNLKIDINDPTTWNPVKLQLIEEKIISSLFNEKFSKEINILRSKRSFLNHLKQEDSEFIKAMQEGHWVLIDGIEAAPKELFEKLASLCSNNPVLNLYERGPEYIYSRDAEGEFKIHEDFHLFITYNPDDIEPSRRISQSTLNKFLIFVLQQIDVTEIMSGLVLHGSMNNKIDEDLNIVISSTLAMVHETAKNYSYKNINEFAAYNKFTGRSLLFNMNVLSNYLHEINIDNLPKFLNKCICLNYCSTNKDPQKFYKFLTDELVKEPNLGLIQAMKKDVDLYNEKYKNILIDLYDLQTAKNDSSFNLKTFFKKILQFEYGDIETLIFHIVDTLNQLDTPQLINKFGTLTIILQFLSKLFEVGKKSVIKSTEYKLLLDDKIFFKNARTTHYIAQMMLVQHLIENNLLIEYTPICFYSSSSLNTINEIAYNMDNINFQKIIWIISKIIQTPSIFHEAFTIINCNRIRQSNFANVIKLIPLFILLRQNQIHFSINSQDIWVSFSKCDYSINFSISETSFELKDGSKILYQLNPVNIKSSFYSAVQYLVQCLVNNVEPDFAQEIPQIEYPLINKDNHPLFNLYPNDSKSRILKLFKTSLLINTHVDISLSSIFGHFEVEIIKLFIVIWNIIIQKEYKLAKKLIEKLIDIEMKIPEVFTIMNSDLETLKNFKDTSFICQKIEELKTLLKKIEYNFNELSDDFKKVKPNNILQNQIKEWIYELDNKMSELKFDKLKEEFKEEAKKIKDKINILHGKVIEAKKNSSKEDEPYFDQIIRYIEKIEITTDTFEDLRKSIHYIELNIERMINNAKKSTKIDKIGDIPFPRTKINLISRKNIHIEICSIYLNYSNTINLLSNIKNNRDSISISSFYTLSHIYNNELEELTQFLCSNYNESGDSKIELIINKIKSYATALTIQQLLPFEKDGYNFLSNPEKLKNEFEKYINRDEYDEYLVYWAGEMSMQHNPKDMIVIPKYTPFDFHLLFVSIFNGRGLLLKNIIYLPIELIEHLSCLDPSKYKSLVDYMDDVCKIALDVLCNKKVEENAIEVIETENKELENEIFSILIQLYPICKAQDTRKPFHFDDEDLFFKKLDWLTKFDLCAKYPSLTYWLICNQECQKKLRFYFSDYKPQDDEIPLFIHILRIYSSMNCITFQSTYQNDTSKKIAEIIKKELLPKIKNNKSFIMKWINLLLPQVPIKLYDSEISMIYNFIDLLSQSTNMLHSSISKECQLNLFKIIIKKIIDSIFENKIHYYFTNELNDDFSEFIKNPHGLLICKIKETFDEERKNAFVKMKNDANMIGNALKKIQNTTNLRNAIQNDTTNAINAKINDEKNKQLNSHENEFNEFLTNLSTYEKTYNKIFNNELDDDDTVVCNDIRKMHQSQNYFNKKKYKIIDEDKGNEVYKLLVKSREYDSNFLKMHLIQKWIR